MDRLTFDGNFCDIAMCQETPGGSFCEDGYCSQRKVWERLKAYEDAEAEGRLIVLPCKVGDTAWSTLDELGKLRECEVVAIHYGNKPYEKFLELKPKSYTGGTYGAAFGAIGKTVFLSRKEAERALKGESK